jgi:N-acetylmuramoyl-L-alanine amidase
MHVETPYTLETHNTQAILRLTRSRCALSFSDLDMKGSYIATMDWKRESGGELSLRINAVSGSTFRHFALDPNKTRGHRIVVDLVPGPVASGRDIIIAVDAGHGGRDAGAISSTGYHEKVLTLAVARYIVRELNQSMGLSGVLIRDTDTYLSLQERVHRAREASADVFLSVHGDSFYKDKRVSGASVFVLSASAAKRAIDSHALDAGTAPARGAAPTATAPQGVDPYVSRAFASVSMRYAMDRSLKIGDYLLNALRKVTKVHNDRIKQESFVVLRPIDGPSLLVELGFLSNAAEARLLAMPERQQELAAAIAEGLLDYFKKYPLAGSYLAGQQGAQEGIGL